MTGEIQIRRWRLYREWRGRLIYGVTLTDAVTRAGKLQRPDQMPEPGHDPVSGEWIVIKRVVAETVNPNSRRGDDVYHTVLIETSADAYMDVDARDEGPCVRR